MKCSNVLVQGITILAPVNSPNTDGINPGRHVDKYQRLNILKENSA